jgi:imidazolonepropionase-like amidohydrolase
MATWHCAMPSTTAGFRAETSDIGSQDHRLGGQAVYLQNAVSKEIPEQEISPVTGPDEARRAVRENFANGGDLIKIVVDAGAGPTWEFRYLSPEDAKAAVEDTHRLGLKVAAHATSKVAIQTAIDAGVDSVEHGDEATDQQLKQMEDKGIVLVATDLWSNGRQWEYFSLFDAFTPADTAGLNASQEKTTEQFKDRLQRAMKIGVKIAMGSDMWCLGLGKTRREASLLELVELQKNGMPNLEIIGSSTVNAAELMGWSDRVGRNCRGKIRRHHRSRGGPSAGYCFAAARRIRNEGCHGGKERDGRAELNNRTEC